MDNVLPLFPELEPQPGTGLDPIPTIRGVLTVALERCPAMSEAALELCAVWELLDELSPGTGIVEKEMPSVFPAGVVVAHARRLVRDAIFCVQPLSLAFVLGDALRHLEAASLILAGEEFSDGPTWA